MVLGTFATKSTQANIEYKESENRYNPLMFTLDQIREAHAKVKSGADFPHYVQDLITLGVKKYDIFVHDGHGEYFGDTANTLVSPAKYEPLTVADTSDASGFRERLQAHQKGETDYMTFCRDAAHAGALKWTVDTEAMTCTYYDKGGNMILEERISRM